MICISPSLRKPQEAHSTPRLGGSKGPTLTLILYVRQCHISAGVYSSKRTSTAASCGLQAVETMFGTLIQLAFLSLLGHAYAAASTCSQLPIAVFTPLGKVPAAQAYCTTKYPLVRCTTTQTSTSTQTVLNTVSTATVTTGIHLVLFAAGLFC